MNVLIVDDSPELRKILSLYLRNGGYTTLEAENGVQALKIITEQTVELAILDVMMPVMDGFELVQKIRERWDIPILFLSARDQVADKIMGLTLGADDYIAKPFDPMEVLARVNAQFRRLNTEQPKTTLGAITWDPVLGQVLLEGKELDLTRKEYDILTLLLAHPNRLFSKNEIYERVWDEEYIGDENVVMVHISKLRDKLGPHKAMIQTQRGLGYRLVERGQDD